MPSISNVTRRGAVYHWRRRLPAALAKRLAISHIAVSLRITEQPVARVLADHLNAFATMLFDDPTQGGFLVSKDQITTIIRQAADRHLQRLDRIAAWERGRPNFDPSVSRRSDIVMSWCYRLLASRGDTAKVDATAKSDMIAAGLNEADCAEVDGMLDGLRAQRLVPHHPDRLRAVLEAVGAHPHGGNARLAQTAIYRGYAAALRQTERRWDGIYVEDDDIVKDLLRRAAPAPVVSAGGPEWSPPAQHAKASDDTPSMPSEHSRVEVPETTPNDAPSSLGEHAWLAMGRRFAEEAFSDRGWTDKSRRQALQTFVLFAKLLSERGVTGLQEVKQRHFGDLKRAFINFSKNYGKAPADDERSIAELEAIGKKKPSDQRGLEPPTVRRHLGFLQNLVDWARANGEAIDTDIRPALLKPPKGNRERSKRATFSSEDLTVIFEFAFFTGCKGWRTADAFLPGEHVFHRALYFAVLMLHYMGARREEICGLDVDDIGTDDGIPYAHIRDNAHRSLKNSQSERFLPIHPEALRLGFPEYVDAIRALGYHRVFPDLHSGTTDSPSGDKLYDELMKGIAVAIPEEGRRKKVLHSLRKTFGAELKRQKVDVETRADLLGHGGRTVTDEIYVDPTDLKEKLAEMLKLPNVTGHLSRFPMRLIPWVAENRRMPYSGRKPRARRGRTRQDGGSAIAERT